MTLWKNVYIPVAQICWFLQRDVLGFQQKHSEHSPRKRITPPDPCITYRSLSALMRFNWIYVYIFFQNFIGRKESSGVPPSSLERGLQCVLKLSNVYENETACLHNSHPFVSCNVVQTTDKKITSDWNDFVLKWSA